MRNVLLAGWKSDILQLLFCFLGREGEKVAALPVLLFFARPSTRAPSRLLPPPTYLPLPFPPATMARPHSPVDVEAVEPAPPTSVALDDKHKAEYDDDEIDAESLDTWAPEKQAEYWESRSPLSTFFLWPTQ